MFVPIGFLISWIWKLHPLKIVLLGTLFSLGIEIAQYFLRAGLCEIDDIINNSIGTALGVGYCKILERYNVKIKTLAEKLKELMGKDEGSK